MNSTRSPHRSGKPSADPMRGAGSPTRWLHQKTLWLKVTAALLAAVLLSSVSVTADATSVFQGASLPQVLVVLMAAVAFSFSLPVGQQPSAAHAAVATNRPRQFIWIGLPALGCCWLIASTLHASWVANGRAAWNGFWHVTALICFVTLLRQLCLWPDVARTVTRLLIACSIILAIHGLYQRFVTLPEARAQYEANPEQVLMQLQLDAPPGSATRRQYENRLYSSEAVASFALANSLAVVLTGALTTTWLLLVLELLKTARRRGAIVALSLTNGIVTWAWVLTKSRSAYAALVLVLLGSLLAIGISVYQRRRTQARGELPLEPKTTLATPTGLKLGAVLFALAAGLFGLFIWTLANDRLILSEAPKSLLYRIEYWQATAKMILTYGWTGVGLGNFQSYYPQFKLPAASEIIADPHNIFLDLAASCSVPCLIIMVIILMRLIIQSVMVWRVPPTQPHTRQEPSGNSASFYEQPLVRTLWIGGAVGLLGSIILQTLLRESVDVEASLLGITLAAVVLPFGARTHDSPQSTLQAVALGALTAMLICLLTTGSWQASGIAFPLLAWLAIAAPAAQPVIMRNQRALLGLRVGLVLLLVAFVLQTWRPVNSSWAAGQAAMAAVDAADWDSAESLAQASVAADRLDPTACRLLVQIRLARATADSRQPFSQSALTVQQAIEQLLECDPASAGNWSFAAEQSLTLASLAERARSAPRPSFPPGTLSDETIVCVERAAAYGAEAVRRYPSSVALHVQLGVTLAILGRRDEAHQELEVAVSLSDKTPHLDRQLAAQQTWLPTELSRFPTDSVIRPKADSSWVQAEPLCNYLRNSW